MKNRNFRLAILVIFFLGPLDQAYAGDFLCKVEMNSTILFKGAVSLESSSKQKIFFKSNQLEVKIIKNSPVQYELEIYDSYKPSRNYSGGVLREPGDQISHILWDRESLLTVECVVPQSTT